MDFIEKMILAQSIANKNPQDSINKAYLKSINKTGYDIDEICELADKVINKTIVK
jgi:methionine aminopeptidase